MNLKYDILSKHRSSLMGMAMLIILVFHAVDLDLGFELLNNMRTYMFIGVDMFIFLSGLGISMSLSRRLPDYTEYMKRRAKRILPAYYIVVIPWTIFYALVHGGAWSSLIWNTTLLAYWVKPAGTFNWYVTGIMLLYAIAPIWHKFKAKFKRPELVTLGAIILTLLCTLLLMREGYWYFLDIIYRVPIFLIGMLIGGYIHEGKSFTLSSLVGTIVSLAIGIGLLFCAISALCGGMIVPCFAFIPLVFPFLFFVAFLLERLPLGLLERCLKPIGDASLEIYLLNASIFIETALLRKIIHFGPTNRLYYLIIFTLNIALGIGFSRLMKLIRAKLAERKLAA